MLILAALLTPLFLFLSAAYAFSGSFFACIVTIAYSGDVSSHLCPSGHCGHPSQLRLSHVPVERAWTIGEDTDVLGGTCTGDPSGQVWRMVDEDLEVLVSITRQRY